MFPRHAVVLTAAGSSQRFNKGNSRKVKKEFLSFEGHSVLYHALKPFFEVENLSAVAVTYKEGTLDLTRKALEELAFNPSVPVFFVQGGKTRQESVRKALEALSEKQEELGFELVSIHDGARPFVRKETIENCLGYAKIFLGAVPVLAVRDSLVKLDENGCVAERVDRTDVYQVQTPQTFKFSEILKAHRFAFENKLDYFTDDTAVFSCIGLKTVGVSGDRENRKVTYPEDLGVDTPDEDGDEEAEISGCTGNCSVCHGSCIKEL